MTKLKLIPRKITELTQDPRNARVHNRRNLDQIKASLKRFGQQKPIVVTKDGIVRAGNGTLAAAEEMGWETIDTVESSLTEKEAIAYGIADNRINELSDWDAEQLIELVGELGDDGLLDAIGFDSAELDELLPSFSEAPEVQDDRGARLQRRDDPTVRVLVSVAEVGRFERAIEHTGLMNRASALMEICDHYVKTKRQLDPLA